MTDTKHTPDRIWFTKVGKSIVPNSERRLPEDKEYILSTPTREAADELLEALEALRACIMETRGPDAHAACEAADAAIAKAKGEGA